ncbi:UDP-2,4-diacetamido-2,4,6-trideoxy-beta-L-altropyranose hydrolase [Thioalkalivibrio sp. XN279]|uniref:UDP-2,4-diacetamido-2,4, 6-trideoxy-beta-L-altropyranose hydrolase n=1 Tax=Thioalkalivibrio sp. XN279 TaxID=2714953 RepID=UPI00140DFC11|nr:UDP-2,4-diacetamido-2,4,6-trideoxy-beta-L-altropyranose hydrolase [Thioalkalivibrio sp. XN279]NHA15464.1 UDP-2,4-diacetamido-2,4,6-trideoxy-beta-L-altropyranose hydrolase [Thioalkalivibrio sp. XN279]
MSHGATPQPSGPPRIVFRADASLEIGTGHVMRCLALAEALRERGAACEFACRELPGHRIEEIQRRGFPVHVGDTFQLGGQSEGQAGDGAPADWLVVDHYGLDARWERQQRPAARSIMVIDDLADRPHDCELMLDQTLGRAPGDYDRLVPDGCELLCGPEFALLRPEFAELRPRSLARRAGGGLARILVTMGGIDKDNATGLVLEALDAGGLPPNVAVTVVMGSRAPSLSQVRVQATRLPFPVEIAVDVNDMAERMAASDFAIGAAGSTSWERCCMGLPSALVVLADNQAKVCRELVAAGAAFELGAPGDIARTLPPIIATITHEPATLQKMSAAAAAICDGLGAQRVAAALLADGDRSEANRGA